MPAWAFHLGGRDTWTASFVTTCLKLSAARSEPAEKSARVEEREDGGVGEESAKNLPIRLMPGGDLVESVEHETAGVKPRSRAEVLRPVGRGLCGRCAGTARGLFGSRGGTGCDSEAAEREMRLAPDRWFAKL
jgi:hypothetical protein